MYAYFCYNSELRNRTVLVINLSRSFQISARDCDNILKQSNYVLTPDYVMKMLYINEYMECKSPVVLCGETGVGKTFLIEMISKIWNLSAANKIKMAQFSLMESFLKHSKLLCVNSVMHGQN